MAATQRYARFLGMFLAATMFLAGCSMFTPPYKKPIISDQLGYVGFRGAVYETLATTADRRVILIRTGTLPKDAKPASEESQMPAFCAEPAPEAITALTTSLGLTGSAANKVKDSALQEANLQLASAFAQEFKPLAYRTQGLALFRDASFAYCQLWIQGKLNSNEYGQLLSDAYRRAIPLIEKELPLMPEIIKIRPSQSVQQTATANVNPKGAINQTEDDQGKKTEEKSPESK